MIKSLSVALLLALLLQPAHAQQKQPIEVTAQNTLEWDRTKKTYTARGKAIAKQGTTELHANTLTAHYSGNDSTALTRINADGDVTIISNASRISGDNGIYNMTTGMAEVTGKNLKLITPTETVTARDKMTYNTNRREMHAVGNAVAVRPGETISADTLITRMQPNPTTGKDELHEMEAIGHVIITTKTEKIYANRAIYTANTDKANLTGNVRIEREGNIITGARGEIDMKTSISRIFADTNSDTRVRGVFYPE